MRLRALVVATTALALLTAACGGSGDTTSSSSPTPPVSATGTPEIDAYLSLCSVAADVAAENLAGAEATFEDEVHATLHELADRLGSTDRTASAALLQAKSRVEADLLEGAPDPVALGADVDGLLGAMADALGAVGLDAPGCPEQTQ